MSIVLFGISNFATIFLIFLASLLPDRGRDHERSAEHPLDVPAGRPKLRPLAPRAIRARRSFPAALPQVLTGLRIALGIAWLVVVAAEMIAVDSGLGYLVIDSRNAGKRYDLVVAAMLLIGLIGLGLNVLDAADRAAPLRPLGLPRRMSSSPRAGLRRRVRAPTRPRRPHG